MPESASLQGFMLDDKDLRNAMREDGCRDMRRVTRQESMQFLLNHLGDKKGLLHRIRIASRLYICPFDDLLNLLPDHQRVLDVGCGTGAFLNLVARFRQPITVGALETKQALAGRVRAWLSGNFRHVSARVEVYDGAMLPRWVSDYDYVFLIDVLHHVSRAGQIPFLKELFDRMRPGATLILKDIDAEPLWAMFNLLHDAMVSRQIARQFVATELEQHLRAIGFRTQGIIRRRRLVYPHCTIVCERP